MSTTFWFFYPGFACWTLFKLFTFNEFLKSFFCLVWISTSLKFFAWLIIMPFDLAIQTIFFFTFRAKKLIAVSILHEFKCILTVSSRAPRYMRHLWYSLFKPEFLILCILLFCQEILQIILTNFSFTAWNIALNRKFRLF